MTLEPMQGNRASCGFEKLAYLLRRNQDIRSQVKKLRYTELSSRCCAELGVPLDLDVVLRESLELPKASQATCRVSWERGLALEPLQEKSGLIPW